MLCESAGDLGASCSSSGASVPVRVGVSAGHDCGGTSPDASVLLSSCSLDSVVKKLHIVHEKKPYAQGDRLKAVKGQ